MCVCKGMCWNRVLKKGVWLDEHDGSLLGRSLDMCSGHYLEASWEIIEMDPGWKM